ncbi:TAP-like protein-domain-containing protein [Auriculariales sp. MPI-PUGE-AT-0066]|nr:TAP-like protein-domain-containing protein [Auriculariales sp. MPI-PUGE-AT-0066]
MPLSGYGDLLRRQSEENTTSFSWDQITPSEKLEWHPCGDPFLCARFAVPLDYTKPESTDKAAIALIRYPSKYKQDDPNWRGPVLYNPGGPGDSGVKFVHRLGEFFSTIVGEEFDHIGFDPRGVGFTLPQVGVLQNGSPEQLLWTVGRPQAVSASDDTLARNYNQYQILGDLAAKRANETARVVSTAFVARDMLKITEAFGREKLQYWGLSYGTFLGVTFASMFPDKVERLLIDAVVDADDYIAGKWMNNIVDADKSLKLSYAACVASTKCALHEDSIEKVSARIDALVAKLRNLPLVVMDEAGSSYGTIDASQVRAGILNMLYSPYGRTAAYLEMFALLETGDGAAVYQALYANASTPSQFTCPAGNESAPVDPFSPPEALPEMLPAIACGDAHPVKTTFEQLKGIFAVMSNKSSLADTWWLPVPCTGWKLTAAEAYRGPWTGNTSHPLLVIGNTADPVTSLWAAKKMAKGYKDAVVLTQDSGGHSSTAALSKCTWKYIRDYFLNGTLPPPNTVCNIESEIFPSDATKPVAKREAYSQEEHARFSRATEIRRRANLSIQPPHIRESRLPIY